MHDSWWGTASTALTAVYSLVFPDWIKLPGRKYQAKLHAYTEYA